MLEITLKIATAVAPLTSIKARLIRKIVTPVEISKILAPTPFLSIRLYRLKSQKYLVKWTVFFFNTK